MKQSWIIGHAANFGPHKYLHPKELAFVNRLLQCRQCALRRLYHVLLSAELKLVRDTNTTVFHFHSMIRLIQAILKGFQLNHKAMSNVYYIRHASVHYFSFHASHYHHRTLCQTTVSRQPNDWVCLLHGRQVFELFYLNDSINDDDDDNDSDYFKMSNLLPKGRSQFYSSVELTSSDEDADDDNCNICDDAMTVKISYSPSVYLLNTNSQKHDLVLTHKNPTDGTLHAFKSTTCLSSSRLHEINQKWLRLNQPVDKSCSNTKRVHFQQGSPISAVYDLRTYATACKLERRNRMWEVAARNRYFEAVRSLVAKGYDCSADVSLIDDELDDDACTSGYVTPLEQQSIEV